MAADSLHGQILNAYVDTIEGLEDLGELRSNVHLIMTLDATWKLSFMLPVVIVSLGVESITGGTNEQDDVSYPVTVRIVDSSEKNPRAWDTYLLWREVIRKAFNEKRLVGADGQIAAVMRSQFQPSPIVEDLPREYMVLSLPMTFNVIARVER